MLGPRGSYRAGLGYKPTKQLVGGKGPIVALSIIPFEKFYGTPTNLEGGNGPMVALSVTPIWEIL